MSGSEIELKELVQSYLAAAGGYGKSVPLSDLNLSREKIEDVLGWFDEDYHISRYFHFVCAAGANFQINGYPQTHISIDSGIESVL
jgi:hypothetical protein